jgi:RNA polymerase sigma-70 factor (ECF subfamily)
VIPAELLAAVRRLAAGIEVERSAAALDAALRPRLLAYFRSRGSAQGDAEDLVQEALTRVYQGVGELRDAERFLPWLFTIARRVALDQGRGGARLVAMQGDEEDRLVDEGPDAQESQMASERRAALRAAIENLPPQQRRCLLLRVDQELSYEDIAALLRLSGLTVRNHLAQARKTLRSTLGETSTGGARP